MRLIGSLLRRLSPLFRSQPIRLQSQMDIHPGSLWHNPRFVEQTGGFRPPGDKVVRTILSASPWDTVRRDMLVLLMRDLETRQVQGSLAELGVYKGETARLIHHYLPDRRLHLFDTFDGFSLRDEMSESAETGATVSRRQFSDTSMDAVRLFVRPQNSNVSFHVGVFPESFDPTQFKESFALVHLDADLYRPTLAGLEAFYPLVTRGGYIVVHDYNAWQGARKATDDFLAGKPEVAVPMPDKCGSAVIARMAG